MTTVVAVIACLNEQNSIASIIGDAQRAGARCVVSDGQSTDDTALRASQLAADVVQGEPGRARQLNRGAQYALEVEPEADWLLFLHADVRLPHGETLKQWIAQTERAGAQWARFDVQLDWQGRPIDIVIRCALPICAWLMNTRSALSGICTGDQGLLVNRSLFDRVGGFPDIALMEDIDMSVALKRAAGHPCRLRSRIKANSRRWERDGFFRTMAAMWWFRWRYFLGASASDLHREYYRKSEMG